MKHISSFLLALAATSVAMAQGVVSSGPAAAVEEKPWKLKLAVGINLNQSAFTNNWKGGGVTSVGMNAQLAGLANYKKERHSWDNTLDALFGFVYRKTDGYQKTLDRIYLDSKYGYAINDKWGGFVSFNFLSQFDKGYDTEAPQRLISQFAAPAYLTWAIGVEYKPVDFFVLRMAPLAPRLTIVENSNRFVEALGPIPYGVVAPNNLRVEAYAFQILAELNKDLTETININARYILYGNYETIAWKTLDHRLDVNIIAKVWKYIDVSLGGRLIYDYDQDPDVQLSQLFTLGFAYTIKNFEQKEKE